MLGDEERPIRADGGESQFDKITDYLLPEMPMKLLHCCQVCGLTAEYESGSFSAEHFVGMRGRLALGIEKDKCKKYPDKNVVTDYTAAPAQMLKLA